MISLSSRSESAAHFREINFTKIFVVIHQLTKGAMLFWIEGICVIVIAAIGKNLKIFFKKTIKK